MNERYLLFKAPMVRALLAGRKTQTRRLIAPHNSLVNGYSFKKKLWPDLDFASPRVFVDGGPSPAGNAGPYLHVPFTFRDAEGNATDEAVYRVYPRVAVGDREWVKETWGVFHENADRIDGKQQLRDARAQMPWACIVYRATDPYALEVSPWRPSIFMQRWASRVTLEVTKVRAERVKDISDEDAIAEGAFKVPGTEFWTLDYGTTGLMSQTPRGAFRNLWQQINGADSWNANPWCWVRDFKRVEPSL